jgi:hypothetical protein
MNTVVTVQLNPDEIHLAATHGLLRRFKKLEGRRGDRIQKMRSDWDNEIEGAGAELAWAKLRRQYWSGVAGLKAKDGADAEIRWTKHDNGGLIIYKHDPDDAVFVLAKGFAPEYRFVGWILGRDGKQIARETNFGLLVPADELHPMSKKPPTITPIKEGA